MRARDERVRRLVEADVTVRAEPEDLQVDAACALDRSLVARALGGRVARHPVQEMDLSRRHVHVIEEMPTHERAVAAGIRRRETDEFVEIERRRLREIDLSGPIAPYEL